MIAICLGGVQEEREREKERERERKREETSETKMGMKWKKSLIVMCGCKRRMNDGVKEEEREGFRKGMECDWKY